MSDSPSQSAQTPAAAERDGSLPSVELEVSHGGRATSYALSDVDFLIGTVPGCDLRVPGADLPAVLCILARRPSGLALRKLAPTQVILVNGQTAARAELADGDRVTLGAMDIFVRLKKAAATQTPSPADVSSQDLQRHVAQVRAQVVRLQEERKAFEQTKEQEQRQWQERRADLDSRERALRAGGAERQIAPAGAGAGSPAALDDELAKKLSAADAKAAELEKQQQELATMRQELADIRRQLYERYQERRDRLAGLQSAVDRAARKVQERKRQIDTDEQQSGQRRLEDAARRDELDRRAQTLDEQAGRLERERRLFEESHGAAQAELESIRADVQDREHKLADERRDLEARLRQYQADLVRLDRLQGTLDERDKKLTEQQAECDTKHAELQSASADLEEQGLQLDDWRAGLQKEADQLAAQQEEHAALAADVAQRSAAVEGQQATLAALRTRLERTREDVRAQEQQLDQERARQETARAELENERQGLVALGAQLDGEQQLRDQERAQLLERGAVLDAAVSQLRQAQDKLADSENGLGQRGRELDQREAVFAEQEGIIEGRLKQLTETQERLDIERQALRERTQELTQTELAREALQEQLRKRAADLNARQKAIDEKMQAFEAEAAGIEARKAEIERQALAARAQAESWRQEQAAYAEELEAKQQEQARQNAHRHDQYQKLQHLGRQIAGQRKAFAEERAASSQQQEEWLQTRTQTQTRFEALRQEAIGLARQLPDVELRAGTALERLTHAREQLRDHLAELHAYVQECREDLENSRGRLQQEEMRLQQQEQALRRGQEDNRLAMVAFRQQMIGWQGQIVDLRRLLAHDETRIERRHALVQEQAKEVGAASEKLAQKAEALQQERTEVAGKRQEMDRHLVDMRQWYRRKLRELAGLDEDAAARSGDDKRANVLPIAAGTAQRSVADSAGDDDLVPTGRDILTLTEPVDDGDRKLGEVLAQLELIDGAALNALLIEARRQRRSLRQVLLASGVVTLYQLALIEAGNVAGLMLGPVRVIDRLRATQHETAYRVFDPRRGGEAVLRHLAEDDMLDAVRPDEFRQRFTQAMITNPHVAATLEVLDIAGRPAVLQEWLSGLPSGDWPPLAAAPGVCFRLFTQAALALDTIHKAGLTHGNLDEGSIFLTGDGILKIAGAGEPAWLNGSPTTDEASEPHADLRALGKIVSTWCTPTGVRKGTKTKPLPDALVAILYRLAADGAEGYDSAAQLLEDLDRAGSDVPPNAEAWERLLRHVREHATPEAAARRSA